MLGLFVALIVGSTGVVGFDSLRELNFSFYGVVI
jgi:hypothetical protein